MKLILKENQVRRLVEQVASSLADDPLNTMRNTYGSLVNSISTEAPEITKLAKSMAGFGDESLIGKAKTIGKILKGNNAKFAPNIPTGNDPMNPLGHKSVITSKFGDRNTGIPGASTNHKGIDLAAPSGSPVCAPLDGTVISSRDTTPNACGGFIQLSHTTMQTKFCHLRQMIVKQGDKVKKGQIIGYTGGGATDPMHGIASGPHLHYEILDRSGMPENPLSVEPNLA
jgi:murein DD-endopeptidase MepM/ murein hydrolase activator NlpD